MNKLLLSLLPLAALAHQVDAQTRQLSGRVTDRSTGEGLPGATVLIKGTTTGVSTNADGSFTLSAPAAGGTLLISSVGYLPVERTIGTSNEINIGMAADTKQLGEVVVTAFGIEREARALTYTTQEVKGEALTQAGQPNITNALQGRVAGVVVRQSSGMPGSSSQITIRGSRFITGNNQPLYVVDGLPIESNPDFGGGVSGTDASSRALDINPNDIESINVLKGGAAAALYGNRANNGVVVITTKRGKGLSKPAQVSYITDYSWDRPSVVFKPQDVYAQGTAGAYGYSTGWSWGPKLAKMDSLAQEEFQRLGRANVYVDVTGQPLAEPGRTYDNIKPFFRTGRTMNQAVEIAGSNDLVNYSVGLGYTDQVGIIANTGMKRYTGKISGDLKVSSKLTVGISSNYANNKIDKLPGGSNLSNPQFTTYYAPRSFDLWGLPFERPENPNKQYHYRASMDNPRWALKHNKFDEETNRFFGSTNATYKFTDWLSLNYRLGIDAYTTEGHEFYDLGSGATGGRGAAADAFPNSGEITNYAVTQNQVNSNANLQFNKDFTDDINVSAVVGNEFYDLRNRLQTLVGSGVAIGSLQNIDNTVTQQTYDYVFRTRTVGFYGNVNGSWKGMVYLNAGARQDYLSNLPRGHRTIFYPTAGLGFVVSELVKLPQNVVNFIKLRASYAETAQPPNGAYLTRLTFNRGGSGSGYLDDGLRFPFGGVAGATLTDTYLSDEIRPVNVGTSEFGVDLRFLNNRLTIDYSYFITNTRNQLFSIPLSPASGYDQRYSNGGDTEIKGHELVVTGIPVQTESGFNWTITTNLTALRNKVLTLNEGVENVFIGGFVDPSVRAQAGNYYPVIFGTRYLRSPDGQIVVDDDGRPKIDEDERRNPRQGVIGNVQPRFELGVTNNVSYKGLNLMVQVDTRRGGEQYAGNTRLSKYYGIDRMTVDREKADYIFPGVRAVRDANGETTYVPNDIPTQRDQAYWQDIMDPINESNVYRTDFIRLREVALTYSLPTSLISKTKVFSAASLSLTGRNLLLITDYPNFDPETSIGGATNFQGIEYVSLPQMRSYGVGLRVTF